MTVVQLKLLLSGDVELNPGPPKRGAPKGAPPKEKEAPPPQDNNLGALETKVREYEEKVGKMEKTIVDQGKEIVELQDKVKTLMGVDEKLHMLTHKIDAITGVYDDLHEKMHEIDKTRKNNLMIYGLRPDFLPEIQSQLETKVHEIFKHNLQISREIQTTKIARLLTGPEVRGCRPVVVNFANFRDREEILSKSKLLRGSNVYITEDLSRKLREHRNELTKFMREIKAKSPHRKCAIRYDKLYVDNTPYVYDEHRGTVVRYFAPEPLRSGSRTNYSSLDGGLLVRSTSFPSVNGDPERSLHSSGGDRGGSRISLANSSRGEYASTESLHLTPGPPSGQYNSLPPTDENAEANFSLISPNSDIDRKNAPSPSKIRSDEEVETLQLTKKEKKNSVEEKTEKPSSAEKKTEENETKPEDKPEDKPATENGATEEEKA